MSADGDTPQQSPSPRGAGPAAPPPAPSPAGAGRRRSVLRTAVWTVLALLVLATLLLGGGAWWLLRSPSGLDWAVRQVPGLSVQGQQGQPTGGPFSVQRLQWQGGGRRVIVEGLAWNDAHWTWRPHPGAWLGLRLDSARAASVQVLSDPAPRPAQPPAPPPEALRLPIALQASGLRVGRVVIDSQVPITDIGADLHLGAANGSEHRVQALRMQREGLVLSGQAVLGSGQGLPLNAQLQLAGLQGWQAGLTLQGPLQRLAAEARLQQPGGGASVDARATVAPFAAWPLLALAAQAEQLDLSTLGAGLPQTRLSGSARLTEPSSTQTSNDPLALDVQLQNAEPGALDADRLPLRSLQVLLQGRPADPGTLVFDTFSVQLAGQRDAGVVQGSGGLRAGRLQLQLRLDGVRPELLHTAAPAMALGGTVGADVTGLPGSAPGSAALPAGHGAATGASAAASSPRSLPGTTSPPGATAATDAPGTLRAAVDIDLAGRLPRAGTPPLTLQAAATLAMPPDGTLQATLNDLQARAGSSGSASGRASAARNAAGDWQLQSRGTLARFDPGPWWPAARLGRTPQALNGQWQADLTLLATAPPAGAGTAAPAVPAASAGRPAAPVRAATGARTAGPAGTPAPNPLAGLRGQASFRLADSQFANLVWRGAASVQATAAALLAKADLQAGPNRFELDGTLPHAAPQAAPRASPAASPRTAAGSGVPPTGAPAGFGAPQGTLDIQAPNLAALAPVAALLPAAATAWWPTDGALVANASARGQWPALQTSGTLRASGLRSPQLRIGQADARWTLSTAAGPDAPLALELRASDVASGVQRVDSIDLGLQGTLRQHSLQARATSPVRPPAWAEAVAGTPGPGGSSFVLQGSGGWVPAAGGGGTWRGQIAQLSAASRAAAGATAGPAWLSAQNLQGSVTLAAGGQALRAALEPGRISAFGGALAWQQAQWQAAAASGGQPAIRLRAQIEPLQVAPWLARLQPQFGWRGDLALAGRIAVDTGERLDADIAIERTGGDLSLTVEGATRALDLSDLRLGLAAHGGLWQLTQAVVGRSVGVVGGLQTIRTTPRAVVPPADAPLEGGLSLIVPQLQVWAPWLPPGWRLGGNLRVAASFAGTAGAPQYRGTVSGDNLAVRNLFEGIHLERGALAVTLQGRQATIERFEFRDGQTGDAAGLLRVTGGGSFEQSVKAQLRVVAQKMRLLDRFDRRISASGNADVNLDTQGMKVGARGAFTIDEGLVDATQADAPKLSSDVVVRNRAPLATAPGTAPAARPAISSGPALAATDTNPAPPPPGALANADVDLRVDLGQALRLRGRGLDTLLRGQLRVTTPGGQLAVNGVVRAEEGTYTAYGQNLRIERGNLIFRGDVATPQLDILALRADIDQRVGVVVIGSPVNPRVRLYSEPDLGQLDTLTWLVLGRAPEGLGRDDTALLQRAALALLAGERSGSDGFLQRLGLDELSLGRANTGGVNDTIISLGKQISKRVYVGYEHALGGAGGTLQLIYRIANRVTLRARTGSENALDAIWTWRWN